MIDEIEVDLKCPEAFWYWRGRQPTCGDVQRNMRGMIQPRRARQTNRAHDLRPKMQRFVRLAPSRDGQFRPRDLQGVAHAKLCGSRAYEASGESLSEIAAFISTNCIHGIDACRAWHETGSGTTSAGHRPELACAPVG